MQAAVGNKMIWQSRHIALFNLSVPLHHSASRGCWSWASGWGCSFWWWLWHIMSWLCADCVLTVCCQAAFMHHLSFFSGSSSGKSCTCHVLVYEAIIACWTATLLWLVEQGAPGDRGPTHATVKCYRGQQSSSM